MDVNAEKDGVRMTWPRAAMVAAFLVGVGVAGARFEFTMKDQQRQITELSKSVSELAQAVKNLDDTIKRPPPETDSKGRILK